jgi:16S rRNA (uracil1498-N3)-methyltransferase
MHLFYVKNIVSDFHDFDKEESKHFKVLRLKNGDTVYLTDGKGNMHKAEILDNNYLCTKVKIVETTAEYNKRPFYLHIAIAPTKSPDRFEWFVEKATEIGVDEISPIICERSEKTHLKMERLEKIVESATKQSFSAYLPRLNQPKTFNELMAENFATQKFIAYCTDTDRRELITSCLPHKPALILIGPEGDFSENEIALAKKNHFIPVNLGNSRLRTETAGVVACTIINQLNY